MPPRLSAKEVVVLKLLVQGSRPMYGLELVVEAAGALKRGTVYVTLDRMEDKGYIVSTKDQDPEAGAAAPRRYRITGLGQRAHAAWASAAERFAGGMA